MLDAVSLVAAYGLWHNQRRGIILIIPSGAVGMLLAASGILGAPTRLLWASALGSTLLNAVISPLCLWRDSSTVER